MLCRSGCFNTGVNAEKLWIKTGVRFWAAGQSASKLHQQIPTAMPRKTVLYIAASLDGYIAKPGDDLSFLSVVQQEGEDYGYHDFMKSVDTVILGRRTYDWVMTQVPEFPHRHLETYVITRTARAGEGLLHYYAGDLTTLVNELKSRDGGNIFIDGGAEVVNMLLRRRLIDGIIISVIPVLLGDGIRLFADGRPEQGLHLASTRSYPTGLVQLHYTAAAG
jgi:dihydrofolate reductase